MKSASRRRSNSRLRSIDTISGRNKNNVVTDCSVNDRTTNDDKNRKFDVSDGTKADLIFVEKKFRSGDRFEGYYNKKSGKREGFGLYIWHNGDSYKGFWVDGCMHGNGWYYFNNADTYFGEWYKNAMTGKGLKHCNSDGSTIEGSFDQGKAHGLCRKTFEGGDSFTGFYSHDTREGYGEYVWYADKLRYTGNWKDDLPNGIGEKASTRVFISESERRVAGLYAADNVMSYQGSYDGGMRSGMGIAVLYDGCNYIGNWEYNQMNGVGRLEYDDGVCTYEGEFRNGMKDGRGIIEYSAAFDDDDDDDSLLISIGIPILIETFLSEKGGSYEGEFQSDRPGPGCGCLTTAGGRKYIGDVCHKTGIFIAEKIWE